MMNACVAEIIVEDKVNTWTLEKTVTHSQQQSTRD
jgi:hypothetical protein